MGDTEPLVIYHLNDPAIQPSNNSNNTNSSVNNNNNNVTSNIPITTSTPENTFYTMDQVKKHNKATDLWMVIQSNVYDLTPFFDQHPGGSIILEGAGKDSTYLFEDIGHSDDAYDMLDQYLIGKLLQSPNIRDSF
ncbi:cytochrome b5 C [Cavenderia fasciculata]|uniref:Cytochrome b5 C n=1 Tax=Cavenderia fasciculata TaxID=261658 RepID=F4QFQ2_CACFS|nr:cytochrome b5 C [Cavenderia fasciculata]EGG13505.1 cytochrome b5 C [Cavenderia fasciculata]|eukprot:XP_004350209.1 cytochrome b5 C [Cavenderia fasciculata]